MGKMKWVSRKVIKEIEDIKDEKKIKTDSEAFSLLTNYARVGREAERLRSLNIFARLPLKDEKKLKRILRK